MEQWPADQIERRPISALVPYARNARVHTPDQVRQLQASMVEFGWTMPVLVDEKGVLIAGHGRLMAAAALVEGGRAEFAQAPTMVARGWTKAQIQAYRLADNRLALSAGWDPEYLRLEMEELREEEFDLELIGFDDEEIKGIFGDEDSGGASRGRPGSLAEDFGVPPFTVLVAREGWWQERKRGWLALGIESEIGRGAPPAGGGGIYGDKGTPTASVMERYDRRTSGHTYPVAVGQGGMTAALARRGRKRANATPGGGRDAGNGL